MVVLDARKKRQFYANDRFEDDMWDALSELVSLEDYYKDEYLQTQNDIKMRIEQGTKEYYHAKGRLEAYRDHLTEIGHIIETMRGRTHDV